MCRNIRTLYNFEPPATDEEIHAAALQYVRKISGFNKPSRANEDAFDRAVRGCRGRFRSTSSRTCRRPRLAARPRGGGRPSSGALAAKRFAA